MLQDEFYDEEKAVKALKEITEEQVKGTAGLEGVHQLAAIQMDRLSINPQGPKGLPFLCSMEEGELEPAYVRVQGIIASKLLPPMSKPHNLASMKRSRGTMRQAVTLTGLGCETFAAAVKGVETIYMAFYNHLAEDQLMPLEGTSWNEAETIEAYCRYFTHRLTSPLVQEEPISPVIDPEGVLQSLCDGEYVYTTDNVVDYKVRTVLPNGAISYKDCPPTQFKCGDIVEATITFACLPTRDKKMRMVFILKALTLLNSEVRNEAAILKMRSRFPNFVRSKGSKRRATYREEEQQVKDAQVKMARMTIDEVVE